MCCFPICHIGTAVKRIFHRIFSAYMSNVVCVCLCVCAFFFVVVIVVVFVRVCIFKPQGEPR